MEYVVKTGLIAFSHEGKDYIFQHGEKAELPACEYVDLLKNKGFIVPLAKSKSKKQLKNDKK